MNELERAWLAGFIDGEGCITVGKRLEKRRKYPCYHLTPVVEITSTSEDTLILCKKMIGDGKIHILRSDFHLLSNRKRVFQYQLYNTKNILNLMKKIRPFLRLKKKHGDLMIEFCELRINCKNKWKRYGEKEFEIEKEFKKLNKKGKT